MTVIPIRPDVAPPPDATKVFGWEPAFVGHTLHRFFYGTQRGEVGICGYQNRDGTVHGRSICVDEQDLDAAAARELARALIATADELDELAR